MVGEGTLIALTAQKTKGFVLSRATECTLASVYKRSFIDGI